jgi:hypothetical protein
MKGRKHPVLLACLVIVAAFAAFLACGCGSTKSESDKKDSRPAWVQTELYFGRGIPTGGEVTEEAFQQFLEEVVTKEFPAGLTVYDAYGQQQDKGAPITHQKTKVVLLVHEKNDANAKAVNGLIEAYRARFGSPQVMHTTQVVDPEFFPGGASTSAPTTRDNTG